MVLYALRDIREGEELTFHYDGSGKLYEQHRDKYPFIKAPGKK
jgi:SET domain-containing protein